MTEFWGGFLTGGVVCGRIGLAAGLLVMSLACMAREADTRLEGWRES